HLRCPRWCCPASGRMPRGPRGRKLKVVLDGVRGSLLAIRALADVRSALRHGSVDKDSHLCF
ncbi:MAG: hypothetical protein ABGY24_15815, partial [bacterium]